MTMLVDTHCHLDMPAFDTDRDEVWRRAREGGVGAVVIPGVERARWHHTISAARPRERFLALGIHPQVLPDLDDAEVLQSLDELPSLARTAHAVAIGECGFDGGIDLSRASLERQERVMAAHVEIARALDRPLVIHVLKAHASAIAFFKRIALPREPGVIHSFSGSAEQSREYLALGFHLSFAGSITRPNARKPVAAARSVTRDRLLVETDAPDQIPTGATGCDSASRRCEPGHLVYTARRLAEIRGESFDELCRFTTANARRVFALDL